MAADKFEEKERFDGQKVKILLPTYAEGTDQDRYQWRTNINSCQHWRRIQPGKEIPDHSGKIFLLQRLVR